MIAKRIYVVSCVDETDRLVQATSVAQAIRHCARQRYSAAPAKPVEIAKMMTAGAKLETAGEDAPK